MRFIEMDDDDDSTMSDPQIFTRDFSVAVPMLNAEELAFLMDEDFNSTSDQSSSDESDQPSLKRDQRRVHLLNNPDYGIVLDFLEKFRVSMKIGNYSLHSLENDLLSEKPTCKNTVRFILDDSDNLYLVNQRFLNLHLALLKKLMPGRSFLQEHFLTNLTRVTVMSSLLHSSNVRCLVRLSVQRRRWRRPGKARIRTSIDRYQSSRPESKVCQNDGLTLFPSHVQFLESLGETTRLQKQLSKRLGQ